MKTSACWCFADTEKSIWVQGLEVESNTFLRDRQTCITVIRGLLVGGPNLHLLFSRVRKQGIGTKTFTGNRFIGCRIDSSERSFGSTSVFHDFLTAVTCRNSRESRRERRAGLTLAHLCDRRTAVLIGSTHFVSILLGLMLCATRTCCHQYACPTATATIGGVGGEGIIRVDHCLCYLPGARIV